VPMPRKLRVGNKWYSIDVVESMHRKGEMGRAYYDANVMQIARTSNVSGRAYKPEELQDTFWHELTHAILADMGEDALNNNEHFVTGFANRLVQAINTAVFDK